ncbi:MAG TPA: secondary thiamine-phosphate synthase enzyme YjbQ [Kiritimatiellia bacterium]|nr:secondary thiamine-phosphate synthase enzyme YjbQ [Kiritimatiellia bacterium]
MKQISIKTSQRSHFLEITNDVQSFVSSEGLKDGVVQAFVPHTTAGITINEHADPDVVHDMTLMLDRMVPWHDPDYRHGEGNSAAHIKASMMGSSVSVFVKGGRLQLGTWQGIFLCEFDGPRTRQIWLKVLHAG